MSVFPELVLLDESIVQRTDFREKEKLAFVIRVHLISPSKIPVMLRKSWSNYLSLEEFNRNGTSQDQNRKYKESS